MARGLRRINKGNDKQAPLLEKDFLQQVIDLAHVYHYKVAHFRAARTAKGWRTPVQADGKGFPDLILVRISDGRMIIAELKREIARVRPEQQEWLDFFTEVENQNKTIEVYVWHPSDFDEIVEALK